MYEVSNKWLKLWSHIHKLYSTQYYKIPLKKLNLITSPGLEVSSILFTSDWTPSDLRATTWSLYTLSSCDVSFARTIQSSRSYWIVLLEFLSQGSLLPFCNSCLIHKMIFRTVLSLILSQKFFGVCTLKTTVFYFY